LNSFHNSLLHQSPKLCFPSCLKILLQCALMGMIKALSLLWREDLYSHDLLITAMRVTGLLYGSFILFRLSPLVLLHLRFMHITREFPILWCWWFPNKQKNRPLLRV
jgi:hypothetical protein